MSKIILFIILFSINSIASETIEKISTKSKYRKPVLISGLSSFSLDFKSAPLGEVVSFYYKELFKGSFVLDPLLTDDKRLVSFRIERSVDPRPLWIDFLKSMGYELQVKSGVDYVIKAKFDSSSSAKQFLVYQPNFRDASFLAQVLSPVFDGSFTVKRAVNASGDSGVPQGKSVSPMSAAGSIDQQSDTLVFFGDPGEIERLKVLLKQVDVSAGEVMVDASVFEVTSNDTDGSALNLVGSILGGHLAINYGKTIDGGDSLRLRLGDFNAAVSALQGDTRVKVLTSPRLRVRSMSTARVTVGADVPTLGSVVVPQSGGLPVRSVEYKSSGVIFEVTPRVRASVIELDVSQQLSSFARTESGVNDSPTLTKRELRTSVSLQDGESVLLGGLTQSSDTNIRKGLSFLPSSFSSRQDTHARTEVLVLLRARRF